MKIGLIGGGAMGEAIIAAVTNAKIAAPADIRVADAVASKPGDLQKKYDITPAESNADAVKGADFVLLAIKPQDFDKAAAALSKEIGGATVLSIMAGVTLARLSRGLGSDAIVRAMPNTPAQVGEGMTAWTAMPGVSETGREGARQIFGALGKEAFVPDERYIDMATALSGSGPAYVFLFIEALIDAGVHVGLTRDMATTMALQTVLGSASYAVKTGRHPADLRNAVTSPGGTTVEALKALEANGFRNAVLEAVIAAFEKSKALGQGDSK